MTATAIGFASRVDAFAHGEYRSSTTRDPLFLRRVSADGVGGFAAAAGRYHLYSARTSPAAHRVEVLRHLAGLADVVSISHVDALRDARGWAFRASTGRDPVNGFTLLREAYQRSRPGYAGDVRVPLLWDRDTEQVVSDDATAIGIDLVTQFGGDASAYPIQLAGEIERVSAAVAASFVDLVGPAVRDRELAADVRATLRRLDRHLATRRHLLGDQLTDADVRLWVHLVRYDAGPNAHAAIGPALPAYGDLWRYARELYARPAFRDTTVFASFAAPFATLLPWDAAA